MEKIWLKTYPPGVPTTINPDEFSSLAAMVQDSCHRFADRPAFENLGTKITYKELLDKSLQLSAYFQKVLHLVKGDRVAIMLPNLIQYPIILLAALQAGLVVVNINPLYTERELLYPLQDSGAKVIFVLANFADELVNVVSQTQVEHVIITGVGDEFSALKRLG